MCVPIAVGMAVAAAGTKAFGTYMEGRARASNAAYNAQVEAVNRRSVLADGASQAEKIKSKYDKLLGGQVGGYGAANVDPFFGSALAVLTETEGARGADVATTYDNAAAKATAHENKRRQYKYEEKTQKTAALINATSSFLGGLSGSPATMKYAGSLRSG